jgi:hypothetical protein
MPIAAQTALADAAARLYMDPRTILAAFKKDPDPNARCFHF